MSKYTLAVFIGRFQPFHLGHKAVVDRALSIADNVLILVGSSNRSRDFRNAWSFEERKYMIQQANQFNSKISIQSLNDLMYNDDQWVSQVQTLVHDKALELVNIASPKTGLHGYGDARITLIGCEKDHTSFYLKLFPTWDNERVEFVNPINATDIRKNYFSNNKDWQISVPEEVQDYLLDFKESEEFFNIKEEMHWHEKYKENVKKYPRIEQTVDSLVVQSGHILLIRRRSNPGKGLWALPGGFVNVTETLLDSAIRELKEETKIRVPEPVIRGSLVTNRTFDDPNRSLRGRLITQAFLFKLTDQTYLPKVKGSDDADRARWVPLSEIKTQELFEDHGFIIKTMLGL